MKRKYPTVRPMEMPIPNPKNPNMIPKKPIGLENPFVAPQCIDVGLFASKGILFSQDLCKEYHSVYRIPILDHGEITKQEKANEILIIRRIVERERSC